jgi:predicted HTH domain antitoxin
VELILPKDVESRLSAQSAGLHLAIGLFVTEETTLGEAAEIARCSQAEFLKELGRRKIPLH